MICTLVLSISSATAVGINRSVASYAIRKARYRAKKAPTLRGFHYFSLSISQMFCAFALTSFDVFGNILIYR